MNVYFISGLGADSRVFKNIVLPPQHTAHFIDWIAPKQKESLKEYAARLAQGINTTEPFALVGLSMGGMMAAEISSHLEPSATILISSIPSYQYLPGYMRLAYQMKVHKIMPVSFMKAGSYLKRFFTNESNADKKLIRQVIMESDPRFIKWGIEAVLTWNGTISRSNYVHIHGSADWLLPLGKSHPTHVIKNGGHMLVVDRAKEVSGILAEVLGE